jgi:lipopolysaccharide biosynthesis glycosyltransferase
VIRLFIGYDPREAVVYHVCVNSIIRHASQPVAITPLALKNLGGYVERHRDGSNEFTYSRFLVPELTGRSGWALYIDGDMLLRTDIAELWNLRDEGKALLCVHHDYKTRTEEKYLGARNEDYPRKNWSSVILWNCAHPVNRALTPRFVEQATGAELHRFSWLPDDLLGELPREWNWLPDELGPNPRAKLLHWTLGAPCFHEFANAPMAEEWHAERARMNESVQRKRPARS